MLLQQRHTRTPALTGKGHVTAGHVRGHTQAHLLDTTPSKTARTSRTALRAFREVPGIGGRRRVCRWVRILSGYLAPTMLRTVLAGAIVATAAAFAPAGPVRLRCVPRARPHPWRTRFVPAAPRARHAALRARAHPWRVRKPAHIFGACVRGMAGPAMRSSSSSSSSYRKELRARMR
jgi:hypothetical protein